MPQNLNLHAKSCEVAVLRSHTALSPLKELQCKSSSVLEKNQVQMSRFIARNFRFLRFRHVEGESQKFDLYDSGIKIAHKPSSALRPFLGPALKRQRSVAPNHNSQNMGILLDPIRLTDSAGWRHHACFCSLDQSGSLPSPDASDNGLSMVGQHFVRSP